MTWLLVTRRPLWPSFGAWGLFPGFHIAQFPLHVIGNCGVISLVQCSNRPEGKSSQARAARRTRNKVRIIFLSRRFSWEPHLQLPVGDVHNMTVSWRWRLASISSAAPGMSSMMVALLIAGIGLVLAGLLTVGFGVQLDLSFGNTLILAGAMAACTGMILLGIWTVVRELKNIARRLGAGVAAESHAGTMLQSAAAGAAPDDLARGDGGFFFSRDQLAAG